MPCPWHMCSPLAENAPFWFHTHARRRHYTTFNSIYSTSCIATVYMSIWVTYVCPCCAPVTYKFQFWGTKPKFHFFCQRNSFSNYIFEFKNNISKILTSKKWHPMFWNTKPLHNFQFNLQHFINGVRHLIKLTNTILYTDLCPHISLSNCTFIITLTCDPSKLLACVGLSISLPYISTFLHYR